MLHQQLLPIIAEMRIAPQLRFDPLIEVIETCQTAEGAIRWFPDGIWDALNHSECVIALEALGCRLQADLGWSYLLNTQAEDGSWTGQYGNAATIIDRLYLSRNDQTQFTDMNFIAYPAVALFHRFQHRGTDESFPNLWVMTKRAIGFVLGFQKTDGSFPWSAEGVAEGNTKALPAANASIHQSLKSAKVLAETFAESHEYISRLENAIAHLEAFLSRAHATQSEGHAMDWYYAILSGAIKSPESAKLIASNWARFIHEDYGCRCVAHEPWSTTAETAELVMTVLRSGDEDRAQQLLNTLQSHMDNDGVYWMGYQWKEDIPWPREKPSWTQAAVIIANLVASGDPALCETYLNL